MQSATSFFNRALFRKNLQRFWPLWLGYVLIWLLLLPLPLLNELADYHGVPTVADASYYLLQIGAYGGLVMGAVFGIFFAMAMYLSAKPLSFLGICFMKGSPVCAPRRGRSGSPPTPRGGRRSISDKFCRSRRSGG